MRVFSLSSFGISCFNFASAHLGGRSLCWLVQHIGGFSSFNMASKVLFTYKLVWGGQSVFPTQLQMGIKAYNIRWPAQIPGWSSQSRHPIQGRAGSSDLPPASPFSYFPTHPQGAHSLSGTILLSTSSLANPWLSRSYLLLGSFNEIPHTG